jgi:branched-chain amino acid transport system substrate-binding protein
VGSRLVARGRPLAGWACAALLAAGVAGCTAAGSSGPSITGKTLTIYLSAPASLASDPQAQDVVDAEKLAFQQLQGQVTAYKVRLAVLTHNKISDNARQAIGDTGSAIAYLGEVLPGASADSIGITNAQGLLQVSPTDTFAALTQKTPAVANSPTRYYESLSTYNRTFARVVPTTALEAKALVAQMQALGVKSLYVAGDGSEYGRTVALEVRNAASPGITVAASQAGAGAVLFAGSSLSDATRVFDQAAASDPKVKLLGPSALDDDAFVGGLSPAAQRNLYVSAPGLLPKQLAASGGSFVSSFKTAYGHAPAAEAVFGYEAMSAVLAVLHQAGTSVNNRKTVVQDFLAIRNRPSPLGTYSINQNGDTSIGPFVIERVKASTLVPFKPFSEQG